MVQDKNKDQQPWNVMERFDYAGQPTPHGHQCPVPEDQLVFSQKKVDEYARPYQATSYLIGMAVGCVAGVYVAHEIASSMPQDSSSIVKYTLEGIVVLMSSGVGGAFGDLFGRAVGETAARDKVNRDIVDNVLGRDDK